MMGIDQIAGVLQGLSADNALGSSSSAAGAMGTAGVPFAGVLQSMVEQSNTLGKKATEAVTGLLNGSGVEVHDAMIATQKADMAFELTMAVRNKAVGAYQSMLSMQF